MVGHSVSSSAVDFVFFGSATALVLVSTWAEEFVPQVSHIAFNYNKKNHDSELIKC